MNSPAPSLSPLVDNVMFRRPSAPISAQPFQRTFCLGFFTFEWPGQAPELTCKGFEIYLRRGQTPAPSSEGNVRGSFKTSPPSISFRIISSYNGTSNHSVACQSPGPSVETADTKNPFLFFFVRGISLHNTLLVFFFSPFASLTAYVSASPPNEELMPVTCSAEAIQPYTNLLWRST